METVPLTPYLSMLRINGWQVYVWRDGDSVTLIDTGAPGSAAEILSAVPGVDQIVLTHGHVDHSGSAAELHNATGAPVLAGAGDAAAIQTGAALPPPVFEDWEVPIYQRVSVGLPETAEPVAAAGAGTAPPRRRIPPASRHARLGICLARAGTGFRSLRIKVPKAQLTGHSVRQVAPHRPSGELVSRRRDPGGGRSRPG